MKFTGEFFIPSQHSDGTLNNHELTTEHRHRYLSILSLADGKTVLDIACGEGYGSSLLSERAAHVYGVDINKELVAHASKTYPRKNITFMEGSVDAIPVADHSIDMLVSFETLEHVSSDMQKAFLAEAKRVLKQNGLIFISTPDKKNYTDRYDHHNGFHVHELYKNEFHDLLKQYFSHVTLFDQGFEVTSLILNKEAYQNGAPVSLFKIEDSAYNFEGKYEIAICSDSQEYEHISIGSIIPESEKSYFKLIDRIIELQNEVEELGEWGRRSNAEVDELRKKSQILQQKVEDLTHRIEYDDRLLLLQSNDHNQSRTQQEELAELKKLISQSNNDQEKLEKDIQRYFKSNYALKRELERKTNKLNALTSKNKELNDRLQEIYTSDGWKLLSGYYRFKGKYFREGSKPHTALRRLVRLLKPRKSNQATQTATGSSGQNAIPGIPARIKFPLAFPIFDEPVVSIIIPAYNNWVFTRNCLISIYQNTPGIPYEVIIGDNVSTDETVNLEKYFKNINYIRNKENLGYIRNINNAASHAKGKYILTLNNDTTVTPNWLSSMLSIMEKDKSVGLVGSKLVYPDGSLQEAGGIIWSDGSGWNYGKGKDPGAPEYNYVKEVDYISGASNLIRMEIWQQLKGLDERYVPAYFDDSDLAFAIRNLGYKTVYQPLSVVIHYEGLTHGTSTDSGTKKYQAINAQKFRDKWKDVLEKEHYKNGENLFVARDKSRNRKTVVVIDHYVPQFDKDAGSRTTFQLLQLLVKLGFNIKFIGDNFYRQEPYTTMLQQMGIEVLYGAWYHDNWEDWVKENSSYIDFFYLNRPHISIKYIDLIRDLTNAKVFYYGHDLHFLREQKQYEIEKTPQLLESIEEWKKLETRLFERSDVVLTCSTEEKEIIEKETGCRHVHYLPAYYYTEFNQPVTNFDERQNLLFVGGFDHKPNVDAVLWFARKVFPLILRKNGTVKFIIAGSNPPAEVTSLASNAINVLGYLPQEELDNLYKKVKLVVIPLRYGAGVKGKTVEAMYHGVPFVTTQFGIEGLIDINEVVSSHNTEEEFANAVIGLYNNNEKLTDFSRKAISYLSSHFSESNIENIIRELFI